MLDPMTPRVLPIIENLASKNMASDPPILLVALLAKVTITSHQIIEVRDLEGGVMKFGRDAWHRCEI